MPAAPSRPNLAPPASEVWPRLAWAAVVSVGLILLCSKWYGPDIWYHLSLGDRILETHSLAPRENLIAPPALFLNLYWLFQITLGTLHRLGGILASSLFFVAAWSLAFLFWTRIADAFKVGGWGAICALSSILICQPRFDPRPEVISYVFLALQIYWLSTWNFSAALSWQKIAAFALTEVIWANVHGYFIFGPLLVGARLLAAMVDPTTAPAGRRDSIRFLAILLGAVLIGSVISPLGVRTWECVALLTKTLRELRTEVQEFFPPTQFNLRLWTVKLFWGYWLFVLLNTLVMVVRAPRRCFFALATGAAGLLLSPMALRNLPLLVFLSAPIFREILPRLPRRSRFAPAACCLIAATAGALDAWAVSGGFYASLRSQSEFGLGESPGVYPTQFTSYLRSANFSGKVFNAARDGGYLEYHFPNLPIYGDSRFIDPPSVREYFSGASQPEVFRRLHSTHHFAGVVLPLDLSRDVIGTLLRDPAWKLVYGDLHRAFLINAAPPATSAATREKFEFYHGEDLTSPKHGPFAAQWIVILTLANDRAHLLAALRQFSAAPALPSFVGEFALRYAHEFHDREVVQIIRPLRGKFFAANPEDQRQLDNAFADTAAL